MSNGDKEEKKEVGEKKEEKEQIKQKVELDSEQYNALLDTVAEYEAFKATKPHKENEEDDVDSLAREGKKGKGKEKIEEKVEEIDFDNLTNAQLAQVILNEVDKRNEDRLNPLEVTVETLRVLREIDKAERDHEDFWQYEKQVKTLSIKNPELPIEDCYLLAKSKQPVKKEKDGEKGEVPTTRTERLLKLPPRAHGEKPGMSASSTKETIKGLTSRKAAEKAWDDVVGKGKNLIE